MQAVRGMGDCGGAIIQGVFNLGLGFPGVMARIICRR